MDCRVLNFNVLRVLISTSVVGGVVAVDCSCVPAVDHVVSRSATAAAVHGVA
jgi:hypothetical protein